MERQNSPDSVRAQYQNASRLQTRISIHEKYSVNRQGFGNWIFEQYDLPENARILELGCGDGSMWRDHAQHLPAGAQLILTDFSAGMLAEAQKNVPALPAISFMQADVQAIPFENATFDRAIANMMLYHVPDPDLGISEILRVLKKGGKFYCATYGENGIGAYIQEMLADYGLRNTGNTVFTLQNGASQLRRHFDHVEMRLYEDRLEITDANDFADYILSMTSIMELGGVPRDELLRLINARMKNGVLSVPKEYGLFIAQ